MQTILDRICTFVWGGGLIALLLGTGLICTVKLRRVQIRLIRNIPYRVRAEDGKKGGISQMRAVCLSLGAAMGTGNITGVAAALAAGGAGAVVWMWISALLGMALVFAENVLSVKFSTGEVRGPMAYLERGADSRGLAIFFAVCCAAAACGMGGMVQVSSFAGTLGEISPGVRYIAAAAAFIVIYLSVSGGAERTGAVAQAVIPAASLLYAAACVAVLIVYRERILPVFREMFSSAFGIRQAAGGVGGYAVSRAVSAGLRRGVFSNEAGLGSSPILHSTAESKEPERQGFWAMAEVFIDTFVCCTLTAVTILCAAPDMTAEGALSAVFGSSAKPFMIAELSAFAYCTVIGWYHCGETAFRYIFPGADRKMLSLAFSLAAASGAVLTVRSVWTISDIFNGLMAFPNLAGILLLMKHVKAER